MHAAEFFSGAPVDPEEAEVGDHRGGHNEISVGVQEEVAVDPSANVQADARAEAPVEGMGDTHELRTITGSLRSFGGCSSPYLIY